MRSLQGALYTAQVFEDAPPETGLFSWDLLENRLNADAALAELFGLDAKEVERGLAIEVYLDRVHPEDRPSLARTIRDSIVANRPQRETYRVLNRDGAYHYVTGYGRGFRDQHGETVRYVGIVIPSNPASTTSQISH